MTENGKVCEVKGNIVVVAVDKSDSCFGCMNIECKNRVGLITAENSSGLLLAPGQTVEVQASSASFMKQAFAAFLPPLLSFIAGFMLCQYLLPAAGEGAAAGMGIIFLFAAAFIVFMIKRKHPENRAWLVTKIVN